MLARNVLLQLVASRERLVTLLALVRPLVRVLGRNVPQQVLALVELLLADVALQRSCLVDGFVTVQLVFVGELFAALKHVKHSKQAAKLDIAHS